MKMNVNLAITRLLGAALLLLPPGLPARAEDPGLPTLTGGDEVQNAVAAKLVKMATAMKERHRPLMDRTIDDIQRVTHLPEDRLALLRIAGQGALEHILDDCTRDMANEVETRAKGVPNKLVSKVLDSLDGSNWSASKVTEQPRWREAVKAVLTTAERHQWEQVVAQREAYRARALAELVLMQVQRTTGLGDEQIEKLQPLMEKAVRDYMPDVMNGFGGDGDDRNFYTGYLPMFVLGISEKDARTIVKPEQWTKWQAAAGECSGNWPWIKEQHDRRTGIKP